MALKMTGNHEMYNVILNEFPGMTLTFRIGSPSLVDHEESIKLTKNLLADAIQEPLDEEEEEFDLTPAEGWTASEIYIYSRLSGSANGYTCENAKLNMPNYATPLDYFLHFLPQKLETVHHNVSMMDRVLRGNARHSYVSTYNPEDNKRKRCHTPSSSHERVGPFGPT
ncbi:hypothetical protein [Parasitella parasitica]|uniref:Uncharacterized protein n=1 Tax=Parasitella parasitica TaxID=35722 RepID=A0A0B7NW01_9FUNG|nr:hypothetical protein [Parasitella parasitica]